MKHGIHNSSKWVIAATAAVAVIAGGLALGSNMGFKFNAQIHPGALPSPLPEGDNWLSLPDNNPYSKANLVCQHLGLISTGVNTTRGVVSRLISSSGVFQNYTCGTNTALAFAPVTGEALKVRNPATTPTPVNGIVVGSDNPNNTTSIVAAGGALPKGDNWVSVPYHTTAIKANDLCSDMGLTTTGVNTARGIVSRLTASTGVIQNYTCGTNTALAFTVTTGEAAKVRNPVAKSWLPSHF
jgi:hypothetical protein